MKKKDLIELGFTKEHVTAEESGDKAFNYYVYNIGDECFFMSSASNECVNGNYYVEIFNNPEIGKTYDKEVVKEFITVLNKFKSNE